MHGLSIEADPLARVPTELLALCLAWLPFRDRITASHVSRLWRSISLSHPAIWADIDFSADRSGVPMLLSLALSRSGTCPVSITGLYNRDPDGIVAECLRKHLHHVRRIVGDLPEHIFPLRLPAPLLQELISVLRHIDIPVNFLGGHPARLQSLALCSVSLPDFCPALSTVTTLSLNVPAVEAQAATYGRLFKLCPRLTSLSLRNLYPEFDHFLPSGPAPPTLNKLFLSTEWEEYDLLPHFVDWQTDSLRNVQFEQESSPLAHLAQFLEGSTRLHVAIDFEINTTLLTARDAADRTHSITFPHMRDDAADMADMLLAQARDALRALVHVEVPLAALNTLLPVLAALPVLGRLGLSMAIGYRNGVAHRIPLERVPDILRVKARCADSLREIILHIICPDAECPPTPRDARLLANRVLALGKRGGLPRELVVKGFTCDILDSTVHFDQQNDCVFELSFQCQ